MPIYEYVCDDCGHELEALQGISDEVLTDCPACHHAALRRKISAAAFRLKGSGWYETDFKKDNRRNVAGDGGAEGKSEGKSDSKSDGRSGGKDGGGSAKSGETKAGDGKSGKSGKKAAGGD
ncbi:FmdB family zinc ribbon protein [Spiribacter insolitus]|uniref:Zinc ribbon domain-containing protein n=1 Tax=Spiribacter insolitus TaxID=3122417 RepID=A0ABV3T8B8_9GAMM